MKLQKKLVCRIFLSFTLLLYSSCGYQLRGNTRPFFDRNQIHNLYVEPVKNNSYKAGVEITVFNALRKRIALGGYVRIVDKESLADAKFISTVMATSYVPSAITTADQIPTGDTPSAMRKELGNVQSATVYAVSLTVRFLLKQIHPDKVLWRDEISRSKNFPATIFLGATGSTAALINESVYEKILSELAASLVTDAEESINTIY